MRVLVTGVDGFIGSHVAEHLKNNGHEVIGYSRVRPEVNLDQYVKGNLCNERIAESLKKEINKVDAIHHVAANADVWDAHPDLFRTNVHGTWELLDFARWSDAAFIYSSSSAVYGNTPAPNREEGPSSPNNNYALSKLIAEKMLQSYSHAYGTRGSALRYFNTYGIREHTKGKTASIPYQFLRQAMDGNIVIFGDGEQRRDFICVRDTVRAHSLAMEKTKKFDIFNCGSGQSYKFNDVAQMALSTTKNGASIQHIENPLKSGYQLYTQADMTKTKEKLGFVPEVSLEDGIKWMYDYYSRNAVR